MAVEEISWLVSSNQTVKATEPAMAWIFCITYLTWGSMGHHNIHPLSPPKAQPKSKNKIAHLSLSILIHPSIIPPRPGKPHDAESMVGDYTSVYIKAPIWRRRPIANIMIAHNIIDGHTGALTEQAQIFGWEITTGNDQLNTFHFRTVFMALC